MNRILKDLDLALLKLLNDLKKPYWPPGLLLVPFKKGVKSIIEYLKKVDSYKEIKT